MINYKAIGRKVSYYRKCKKYTQAKLAEIVDVSLAYIGQVERGVTEVSLKRLDKIAYALDTDVVNLISNTDDSAENYGIDEVYEMIKDWSSEDKELLLDILRCANEKIILRKKK